jgi:hypothetical protein
MSFGRTLAISLAALLLNCSLFHANAKAQARRGGNLAAAGVYKAQIVPNWFGNTRGFGIANDLRDGEGVCAGGCGGGTRKAAFDHEKLAAALSSASGKQISAERFPFDSIDFIDNDQALRFSVGEVWWKCDLRSYQCEKLVNGAQKAAQPAEPPGPFPRGGRGGRGNRSPRSGDGKWTALLKDHNLFIRSLDNGKEIQLSNDGKEGFEYAERSGRRIPRCWSPGASNRASIRMFIVSNHRRAAAAGLFCTRHPMRCREIDLTRSN